MKRINIDEARSRMSCPVASISVSFTDAGEVDWKGVRSSVDHAIQHHITTLLITPGDSLFALLSDDEVITLTRTVVDEAAGRAMVIASTRPWGTKKCVEFAQYARQVGADILLSTPTPYWPGTITAQSFADHFTAIGKEISTMVITQNQPYVLDALQLLLEEGNGVVALKEDVCGAFGRKVATLTRGRFALLSGGLKENHLDIFPFGADGYLSVYARFKPEVAFMYWNAINTGNLAEAVRIIEFYERPFMEELPIQAGIDYDALVHAAMEIYGIAPRYRRAPFTSADSNQIEILKTFLSSKKLL
jgi:dihydrodipicolinate synthase/N-acetylneuraminate lyase